MQNSFILSMGLVSIASAIFKFRVNRTNRSCRIQTSEVKGQKEQLEEGGEGFILCDCLCDLTVPRHVSI